MSNSAISTITSNLTEIGTAQPQLVSAFCLIFSLKECSQGINLFPCGVTGDAALQVLSKCDVGLYFVMNFWLKHLQKWNLSTTFLGA